MDSSLAARLALCFSAALGLGVAHAGLNDVAQDAAHATSSAVHSVGEATQDAAHATHRAVTGAADATGDAAQSAAHKTHEGVEATGDAAQHAAHSTHHAITGHHKKHKSKSAPSSGSAAPAG